MDADVLKVLKDLLWEAQEARKAYDVKHMELTRKLLWEARDARKSRGQEQLELSRKLLWEAQAARKNNDAIRVALTAPVLDRVSAFAESRQLGFLETVNHIRESGESFARFGDGELKMMLRPDYKLAFQPNSVALTAALRPH